MTVDAQEVIERLARQLAELAIRLAVAESRVTAYERAEVDRMAAQEADNADS